jgi:hypothetical protein
MEEYEGEKKRRIKHYYGNNIMSKTQRLSPISADGAV